MPKTNIPTSLSTSTQIPVDGKTYKKNISDISTVTTELAFTYYVGMRVDIAETNKQYIWKEVVVGETPISNIYTYPANHTVDGYSYGNKQFAFYEIIINNTITPIEPDNRVIYIPNVDNVEYNSPIGGNETSASLIRSWDTTEPNEQNYSTYNAYISPIASTSLRVYYSPINLHNANSGTHKPLRIETYPANSVIIGPGGDVETIEEAEQTGATDWVVSPTLPVIRPTRPIPGNVRLTIPGNVVIRPADLNTPLFLNNGNNQSINILNNSTVTLESPLLSSSGIGSFKVQGEGSIKAINVNKPLLKTTSVIQTVGATSNSNGFKVDISNINIETENTTFGDFNEGSVVSLKNINFDTHNTTKVLINTNDSILNIENNNINTESPSVPLINMNGSSDITFNNNTTKGTLDSLISVNNLKTDLPKLLINNSNLEGLTINSLINSTQVLTEQQVSKIKINNTQVENIASIDNSLEGIVKLNVVDKDGIVENNKELQEVMNRKRANEILPNKTLFINTNDNNVDKETWFLDITIK